MLNNIIEFSLRHRWFGHQDRVRDLGGGEAAEQPQRERDLRVG